jgi:hypothetical protein
VKPLRARGRAASLVSIALLVLVVATVAAWVLGDAGALRRPPGKAKKADAEVLARLRALGYLETVLEDPDRDRSGVVRYDRKKSSWGVNVYCSVGVPRAQFLDMKGRVVRSLALPDGGAGKDCLVEPIAPGRFLALTEPYLAEVGEDGRVFWRSDRAHHHDFAVGAAGEIYTFSEGQGLLAFGERELPVRTESIAVLSPQGALERELELLPLFAERISKERLEKLAALLDGGRQKTAAYTQLGDVLHPNTIEVLSRPLGKAEPGDLLICLRELDLIAVIDPDGPRLVWSWGPGILDRPHHPSVLPNGNILLFDNGTHRSFSRVIELDPATEEIVWEYRAEPPAAFYSRARGSAQALPNGNVLVTESAKGHVFEITRAGEIVWDFWNPDFVRGQRRRQIYRLHRLAPSDPRGPSEVR